ncbi:MAG: hypothetical protein ACXWQO_17195 [Bdellovibrionota bacterium]
MKLIKLILAISLLAPVNCFAYNFCRVDMVSQTTEIRVFALCDGALVADEGAGRNNLGFGLFSKIMGDILAKDPGMKVVNCNGTNLSTCYLSR